MKTIIRLENEAFICGTSGNEYYEAYGIDDDGNKYEIYWNTLPDWDPEVDEEENACDWDNPYEVIRYDDNEDVTDEVIIKR